MTQLDQELAIRRKRCLGHTAGLDGPISGVHSRPVHARLYSLLIRLVFVCLVLAAPACAASQTQLDSAYLQTRLTTDDARHLLMRTGMGARPADIVELRGLSRKQAIEDIIEGILVEPDVPMPEWVIRPLPRYHARQDMDDESRAVFNNQRDAELAQLRQWCRAIDGISGYSDGSG